MITLSHRRRSRQRSRQGSRRTRRFGLAASLALAATLAGVTPRFWAGVQETAPPTRPLVIYLDGGPFVTEQLARNGAVYVPVVGLARRLALPYTDASAAERLTIQGPGATVEISNNDNSIVLDGERVQMDWPVFKQDGVWWAPVEFLGTGLARAAGIRFRYEPGAGRVFAGSQTPTLLEMRAERTESGSRLTIRSGASINVRVQQDRDQNRVVLAIDRAPLAPTRETLDYRDTALRSVAFDDADGTSKIVVETTDQRVNVRLVPSDENRTFVVDFVPENPPPASPPPVAAATPAFPGDPIETGGVRVIVIDPGHGGLDTGAGAHGVLEKDLTLALARSLRASLQTRLNARVILTRDQDREMSAEQRAAIANNSGANLFVSLHVGYSLDPTESSASLFVMHPLASPAPAVSPETLFRPWYRAYEPHAEGSRRLAATIEAVLDSAIPSWAFPVQEAPMGVLASATMPAIALEVGNANNEGDMTSLSDPTFQTRIADAVAAAIEAYTRESS